MSPWLADWVCVVAFAAVAVAGTSAQDALRFVSLSVCYGACLHAPGPTAPLSQAASRHSESPCWTVAARDTLQDWVGCSCRLANPGCQRYTRGLRFSYAYAAKLRSTLDAEGQTFLCFASHQLQIHTSSRKCGGINAQAWPLHFTCVVLLPRLVLYQTVRGFTRLSSSAALRRRTSFAYTPVPRLRRYIPCRHWSHLNSLWVYGACSVAFLLAARGRISVPHAVDIWWDVLQLRNYFNSRWQASAALACRVFLGADLRRMTTAIYLTSLYLGAAGFLCMEHAQGRLQVLSSFMAFPWYAALRPAQTILVAPGMSRSQRGSLGCCTACRDDTSK